MSGEGGGSGGSVGAAPPREVGVRRAAEAEAGRVGVRGGASRLKEGVWLGARWGRWEAASFFWLKEGVWLGPKLGRWEAACRLKEGVWLGPMPGSWEAACRGGAPRELQAALSHSPGSCNSNQK